MKKNSILLFALPAAVPLLLILFSFLRGHWGWTLVNDYQMLTSGINFWGRVCGAYASLMSQGQLKWTHHLRYGFVYTAFAHAPKMFFIYQWGEIVATFVVWGLLAYRLTGKKIAFVLVPAVVLTSRCFYDAFFFPTLGDNFAMLIFGGGLLAFDSAEFRNRPLLWLWVLVLFFLALGAMEFTLAGIMAIGCALCWLYKVRHDHNRRLLLVGISLFIVALLYGVFLKVFIAHGYSSGYRLTDTHKIILNFLIWCKEVFKTEAIWIVAGGVIIFKSWGQGFWSRYSITEQFGIVLGVFMYSLWLAVLLPWHPNGYHAVPLVIVFGFLMAVLLASPIEALDDHWLGVFALSALVVNMLVSQQEIYIARVYNSDIQRVLYFMEGNSSFQQAARDNKVYCNKYEPAESLPHWANRQVPLGLKEFIFEPDVVSAGRKGAQYYVVMTWGSALGTYLTQPGWEPFFVGEFCKIYKKQGS